MIWRFLNFHNHNPAKSVTAYIWIWWLCVILMDSLNDPVINIKFDAVWGIIAWPFDLWSLIVYMQGTGETGKKVKDNTGLLPASNCNCQFIWQQTLYIYCNLKHSASHLYPLTMLAVTNWPHISCQHHLSLKMIRHKVYLLFTTFNFLIPVIWNTQEVTCIH